MKGERPLFGVLEIRRAVRLVTVSLCHSNISVFLYLFFYKREKTAQ